MVTRVAASTLIATWAVVTLLTAACGRAEVTDGHVIAFDGSLTEQWKVQPGGVNVTMAAVAGDRVVMGFGDGTLRGFDLSTGKVAWEVHPGLNGLRYEAPAHHDGLVFTFDSTGRLVALRMADGSVAWELATEAGASALSVADDRVVLALIVNGRPAIRVLDALTGEVAWTTGLNTDGAIVSDGELVFAATADHELVALDLRHGEFRWRQTLDGGTPSFAAGGGILAMTEPLVSRFGDHRVRVLDSRTGVFLWEREVPATSVGIPSTPYPVFGHGQMYMFGPTRQLMAIDPRSGSMKWETPRVQHREAYPGHIAVGANHVYFANRTDLEVLDPATGQQISRKSITAPGGRILVTAAAGGVVVSAFGRPEPSRD